MTTLTVTCAGTPVAQGSTTHYGRGRTAHTNAATLIPWRHAVIASVQQEMARVGGEWPLEGPVKVAVSFHLNRPKSAPRWRLWPDKKPDLDRLVRAVGDALTQSGAIRDDAQIVLLSADKSFGQPGMSLMLRSLEQPARDMRRTA